MSNGKYLNKDKLIILGSYCDEVKAIQQKAYAETGIDILAGDTISLLAFHNIIESVDENYIPNLSRNGEDGKTIFEGKELKIETKTAKVKKESTLTSFAFHAEGKIDHESYIFNVWEGATLKPLRSYYVRNPKSIKIINNKLSQMTVEWQKKPRTKNSYDIIRIDESLLRQMADSFIGIKGCKVFQV